MQIGNITVGTTAVELVISESLEIGVRLLGRAANTGNVFIGTSSGITTSANSSLVPKGDPASATPYTVPAAHVMRGGKIWLIADAAAQVVDFSAE